MTFEEWYTKHNAIMKLAIPEALLMWEDAYEVGYNEAKELYDEETEVKNV